MNLHPEIPEQFMTQLYPWLIAIVIVLLSFIGVGGLIYLSWFTFMRIFKEEK